MGTMRKSRSLPMLAGTPRQPLCPPGRPSRTMSYAALAMSEYHQPPLRWEHANVKLSCLQQYEEKSNWAKDSFDVHRPLQQRLPRPRPGPRWYPTDVGNKLAFNRSVGGAKEAAAGAWDMYRPCSECPPPWAHSAHPRAMYSTSSCMSSSMLQ
eukprot:TRINITY_DN105298_c0_g1_i1.p1 TRINITY_DN105298_c0_g1~~TRINITY_DN105298_c0_g1_i1.p1  ORF type:complete len:179 (-),score=5.18 TRINITY_DN105298_c0_g1_i1:118-576(-)